MNAKKCKAIRRSLRQQVRQIENETSETVFSRGYADFLPRKLNINGKPLPMRLSPDCWRHAYKGMKAHA